MSEGYQKLLVEQLESSVQFLLHERSKHAVGSPEYQRLTKEYAQAHVELVRERLK